MVIILDKNPQTLFIPRGSTKFDSELNLTLFNGLSTNSFMFFVEDEGHDYDYFTFTIDMSNLPLGEYEWTLNSDHHKISRGILILKDANSEEKDPVYYEDEDKIIYYED